jgi:hypothetical protein
MRTCHNWSRDPVSLRLEPPRLHCEALQLLNFDFTADPDLAFYSNANQDRASQYNVDSCGYGSATLLESSVGDP